VSQAPSVRNRKPPGVRREQILAVATEMFGNAGFRGVSLADIATRVGISQPGLIHHFRSKEELLIAALERYNEDSSRHMEEAFRDSSVVDAMLSLCRHNMEYPQAVRLYTVESAESIEPGHPAHEFFLGRYVRVRGTVADRIRRDQAKGRLSADLDPAKVAAEMIAVMDGLQVQWLLDPSFDMAVVLSAYLSRFPKGEGQDG
jgi:AcrR family transcriptional regulator